MNIFAIDKNPTIAAQALDDKRVVKMILESTQTLCTTLNLKGIKTPYKSTHINHPVCLWVRSSEHNFYWLWYYTQELLNIYAKTYGRIHKCDDILLSLLKPASDIIKIANIKNHTLFANCAANDSKNISYKHIKDPTEAYKHYLIDRWNTDLRPPTWKVRKPPYWAIRNSQGLFMPYSEAIKVLYGE